MNHVTILGATVAGINGVLVRVDVYANRGRPDFTLAGIREDHAWEIRDRVRAAIANSGQSWPDLSVEVYLRTHALHKLGTATDLAIAVAALAPAGHLPTRATDGILFLGELGLDGSVRSVRGVVPMVIAAMQAGIREVIIAAGNAAEALLVPGIRVRTATHLREVIEHLTAGTPLPLPSPSDAAAVPRWPELPPAHLCDALMVAAAGGHHLAVFGPDGSGVTAARFLATLFPDLSDDAALEVAAVHSVAGMPRPPGLFHRPPSQAPHHTASLPAILGGGSGIARPGAVSLAHHGLLLLDNASELPRSVIDAVRHCLDGRAVILARSQGTVTFPAAFQLVLAARSRYRAGHQLPHVEPLADRAEIHLHLTDRAQRNVLDTNAHEQAFALLKARVAAARKAASERWTRSGWFTNGQATVTVLQQPPWRLPHSVTSELQRLTDVGAVSQRGRLHILRLAWTLADLAARHRPTAEDISAAITLRTGERQ